MQILTFTTLYPSAQQPQHGIFVETRLRKLVEERRRQGSGAGSLPVVSLCSARFGRYAAFARIPSQETRHGLHIDHPRYPVVPKIGMSAAPLLLFGRHAAVFAPAASRRAGIRSDRRALFLSRRGRRGPARTGSRPPGRRHRPGQRSQLDRPPRRSRVAGSDGRRGMQTA